jgi:hypothetical protein
LRKSPRDRHTAFPVKRREQENIKHDSPPTIRLFHPSV